MWHRLPFDEKRRPAATRRGVEGDAPPKEWIEIPRGTRHARRRPRRPCRSAGTTSSRRARADVPAFSIERHNVTNAQFLEFVDAGGYRDARWWRPRGLALGAERSASSIRCSGSASDGGWLWRGMFELRAAAAGVAGVRQPRGGGGVRAMARRAPADRGRVSARGVRRTADRRRRASVSVGRRAAGRRARRLRLLELGSGARRQPSRPARAPGASRIWSATAGNGRARRSRRSRASSAMASYPEYSADFFDGEHFVMKGASPATARELLRPTLPQLVPRALSVRLRDIPVRQMITRTTAAASTAQFAADVAVLPDARAAPAAVALFLRRARVGAVRRDLRAAVVRASRAPRRGCSPRTAARSSAALPGLPTIVELGPGSGAKLATLVEGGRRRRRAPRSAPRRHLAERARPGRADAGPACRTSTSSTYEATYEAGLVQARRRHGGRPHARAVSRIEHRQLRSARRRGISARDPRQPAARRRAARSAPIS